MNIHIIHIPIIGIKGVTMAVQGFNKQVANYLDGKDLTPVSSDYRLTYFTVGTPLTNALAAMRSWMMIWKANLWE
jgi:hypothetical protein